MSQKGLKFVYLGHPLLQSTEILLLGLQFFVICLYYRVYVGHHIFPEIDNIVLILSLGIVIVDVGLLCCNFPFFFINFDGIFMWFLSLDVLLAATDVVPQILIFLAENGFSRSFTSSQLVNHAL